MTEKQKDIVNFLESLVHKRFSEENLNKVLSEKFGEKIAVVDTTREDDDVTGDYNLMFNSEKEETYGYFDIYMLPMRRTGSDGEAMYITEIGYEFE